MSRLIVASRLVLGALAALCVWLVPIVGGSQMNFSGITLTGVAMPTPVASADTYIEFTFGGSMLNPNDESHFSWVVTLSNLRS